MKWKAGRYGFHYLIDPVLGEIASVGWGTMRDDNVVSRVSTPIARSRAGFESIETAKLWAEDQAYRDASDVKRKLEALVSSRGVQAS